MSIRIGCVPEHFSSPIYIGALRGIFKKHLVDLTIVSCPGGTGEMTKLLENNELDVAIALTEGLISHIAKGSKAFKIVGTYVSSPLTWAISAGVNSKHTSVENLKGSTIGISRFGSGSHIMSYVLGDEKGWLKECEDNNKECFNFKVLTDFKGLRNGVNDGTADAFMWERFTTKPYHDSKEVKCIGHITTPWPCFMIAARSELLQDDQELVKRLLVALSESCELFIREKETGESVRHVAETYSQKVEDVNSWFQTVSYPKDCSQLSNKVVVHCVQTLKKAKVIDSQSSEQSQDYTNFQVSTIV